MATIRIDGISFDPAIVRMAGREYRHEHGGLLPSGEDAVDGAFAGVWDALRARRESHPDRFRRWHPIVDRWLAKDAELRATTGTPLPPIPPQPPTHAVPEPGTGGLMLAVAFAVMWLRRRLG